MMVKKCQGCKHHGEVTCDADGQMGYTDTLA